MIKWNSDITAAPKDRDILLFGFTMDRYHDEPYENDDYDVHIPVMVVAEWDGRAWRFCSYDSEVYGVVYDPTHWAEVNTPLQP